MKGASEKRMTQEVIDCGEGKRKEYSTSVTSWFKRSPVSPASPDITLSFSQSSTHCSLPCVSFDSHRVLAPLNEYNCNSQTVSFCSRRLLFAQQTVSCFQHSPTIILCCMIVSVCTSISISISFSLFTSASLSLSLSHWLSLRVPSIR